MYISGILVLFLFFCSLSPNPSFYRPYGVFIRFFLGLGYFVSIYFFFKIGSRFDNIIFGNFWGLQPFFLLVEGGPFIYS